MKKALHLVLLLFLSLAVNAQYQSTIATNVVGAVDNTVPALSLSTTAVSPVGSAITVTISVTKPVTGLDETDFTLTNCTSATMSQVTSNVYTAVITPTSSGTFSIVIPINKCVDSRGHNNTASNTLSLTYNSGAFTPIAADFWLDGTKTYTSGIAGDNNNVLRPSLVTSDVNAYTSTLATTGLRAVAKYNREGIYQNGARSYLFGTTSDFTPYSNGGSFTFYYLFKQIPQENTASPLPVWRTSGTSTGNSQVGFNIFYIKSASVNTFQISICNASGVTPPYQIIGSTNAITDNAYNILKVTFTGSSLTAWVKPFGGSYTQIGQDNTGATLSTANTTAALTWGALNSLGGTLHPSQVTYLKHLVMYKKILSGSEQTAIESYLDAEAANVTTPAAVNVYLYSGQSNVGSASNTGIASDLNGKVGARVFYLTGNSDSYKSGFFAEMQLGVNQNPSTNLDTHGWQMRFGHDMNALKSTYMVGRWVGSTNLIPQPGGGGSWSALSPVNTSDLYPYWMDGSGIVGNTATVLDAMEDLVHVERTNPTVRGWQWLQGENDAGQSYTTRSSYLTELTGEWSTTKTKLWNAGYDTTKARVAIIRITDGRLPHGGDVQLADADFVNAYPAKRTLISTSDLPGLGCVPGGQHFGPCGQDSIGLRLKRYYRTYINE